MKLNLINEPEYTGTFTRDQAKGAIINGSRVKKKTFEEGDSNKIGAEGTVLGSINHPTEGMVYFVEWDSYPRQACLVMEYKVELSSKDSLLTH